uniref:CutA divalent cation tolerance homolog-like n=1 Tax=Cricetulus griseus TaxID=10029 RepID=A0A8C2LCS7_CRIGR
MDRPESRCPPPGSLRLFVLTCLLVSALRASLCLKLLLGVITPTPLCSRAILDKKLAASVNILPKTSSLYFWKGEIEESTEILLILSQSLIRALLSFQRLAHPFEIPEVFSIPMDPGDARYLKWLEEGIKEN